MPTHTRPAWRAGIERRKIMRHYVEGEFISYGSRDTKLHELYQI